MMAPQIVHGGASSWFWIAANGRPGRRRLVGRRCAPAAPAAAARATRAWCRRSPARPLLRVDAGPELRLGRQELRRHPPEDVVHDRLREPDLRVPRHPGRLEPHVAELVDEDLQRHAVLQRVRDGLRERVREAGDRRAFLRHHEEDLARRAVLVQADGDVALVAGDVELVRDRAAARPAACGATGLRSRRDFGVVPCAASGPSTCSAAACACCRRGRSRSP